MRILTIDVEDWFHLLEHPAVADPGQWESLPSRVVETTRVLLDVLEARSLKATFFTLGWVAERHPALVRELAARGHDVGCHSHVHSLIHQQTPGAFKEELGRAVKALEEAACQPVLYYRAPGFSLTAQTLWAFDSLLDAGIQVDSSLFKGRRAHGGFSTPIPSGPFRLPRGAEELLEFPVTTLSAGPLGIPAAGGGYFRVLPLTVLRWACEREDYTMSYFHPRDFDAGQPRLPGLGLLRSWRTYAGLDGALQKFDHLLQAHPWRSLSQILGVIDPGALPKVYLT